MYCWQLSAMPVLCSSSGVFHCAHSNGICHRVIADRCQQTLYDIHHCCVYSEQTPDDGQRNCPRHVEFCSKNKFEKPVHLVGLIIRIYHNARSSERQTNEGIHRHFHQHNLYYSEWRHHDVLENQLVLHKITSAQSIYSRVRLHVSTRC